jgi:hypothetical protein
MGLPLVLSRAYVRVRRIAQGGLFPLVLLLER